MLEVAYLSFVLFIDEDCEIEHVFFLYGNIPNRATIVFYKRFVNRWPLSNDIVLYHISISLMFFKWAVLIY